MRKRLPSAAKAEDFGNGRTKPTQNFAKVPIERKNTVSRTV